MCGRYALELETEQWSELGLRYPLEELFVWSPRYNIAPTQLAPVVPNEPEPHLRLFRWGLVPPWAKDPSVGQRLINARVETLADKPAFRGAFKQRRCIVPASGFYEWRRASGSGKGGKQPYYIRAATSPALLFFAGLWERWRGPDGHWLPSFTIVTTHPNALVASLHDRMPLMLDATQRARWLRPGPLLRDELRQLVKAWPSETLQMHEVSPLVNHPVNDNAQCVAPVVPRQGTLF